MAPVHAGHGRLPGQATRLIGRGKDISSVRRLVEAERLVTLTGAGGSGKTRLAIAVAEALADQYADGVVFVPLQEAHDRATLSSLIGSALGLAEHSDVDVESAIADHLAEREALVVLDNFEQAIRAATLVATLRDAAPRVAILVTSRAPLRLSGEHDYVVQPFDVSEDPWEGDLAGLLENDAVSLFMERARAVRPGIQLDAREVRVVAEITRRLDGLPLAVELAAARARELPPAVLLERLEHRLPLLDRGPSDAPGRQRTMRGTLDWSYDLLAESGKRMFARLSVFSGGWTIAAAERVCGPDGELDALEGITGLVESSLVQPTNALPGEARFSMLQVIHEYAAERLDGWGDGTVISERHARWVLDLVETAEPELELTDLTSWQQRLSSEEENIRSAMRWAIVDGRSELALRIAGSLWRFWHYWAKMREGAEWLEAVLALDDATSPSVARAKALTALGGLRFWQGRVVDTTRLYDDALALRRELGDRSETARALRNAMWAAGASGDHEVARRLAREWWSYYQGSEIDDGVRDIDETLVGIDYVWGGRGAYETAVSVVQEGIEKRRRVGQALSAAEMTCNLAYAHYLGSRFALALDVGHDALRAMFALGHLGRLGLIFKFQSATELALGRAVRAVTLAAAGERQSTEQGGIWRGNLARFPDVIEGTRSLLSPEAHSRAVAAGRAMALEAAVRYALSDRSTVAKPSRGVLEHRQALSSREREVLDLVVQGKTDGEIGEVLLISPKTASVHVANIKGKLAANSRVEIATIAILRGLSTPQGDRDTPAPDIGTAFR